LRPPRGSRRARPLRFEPFVGAALVAAHGRLHAPARSIPAAARVATSATPAFRTVCRGGAGRRPRDARNPRFDNEASARAIARELLRIRESFRRKVTFLWGNHDIIYCCLREYVLRSGPDEIARQSAYAILSDGHLEVFDTAGERLVDAR